MYVYTVNIYFDCIKIHMSGSSGQKNEFIIISFNSNIMIREASNYSSFQLLRICLIKKLNILKYPFF
jgi:hypothetical protein